VAAWDPSAGNPSRLRERWGSFVKRGALTLILGMALVAPSGGGARAAELAASVEGAKPLFSLDALAGGCIGLAEQTDRVVLVHFFATWCEPCRAEISGLQRLAERFTQRRLTILAVDVGEVDPRVRRFFDALPVSFPILLDRDKAVAKAWQVSTLPTTFVLDRTLVPRLVVEGDFDWDRPDTDRKLDLFADVKPAGGESPRKDALTLQGRTP
jgi:peroxiredoxin